MKNRQDGRKTHTTNRNSCSGVDDLLTRQGNLSPKNMIETQKGEVISESHKNEVLSGADEIIRDVNKRPRKSVPTGLSSLHIGNKF